MLNKTVIITGATGGIGKQTATHLLLEGYNVVITGRDEIRGAAVVSEIKRQTQKESISFVKADLSTKQGVNEFVKNIFEQFERIDILINNAGSAANQKYINSEGIEQNFMVNVLAPYMLSKALLPLIKKSSDGRIITLTGGSHSDKTTIDMENLQSEKQFDGLISYSHSKVVMMMLMNHFSKTPEVDGISVNICYPGQASTAMTRSVTKEMFPKAIGWIVFPLFKIFVRDDSEKSAKKASRSSIYLATSKKYQNVRGVYLNKNCKEVRLPICVNNEQNIQKIAEVVERVIAK